MLALPAMLLASLVGLLAAQEPDDGLVGRLDAPHPATRLQAAEELASLGPGIEKWLERRAGRYSAKRQRAQLLAAALVGTPEAHELLRQAAQRGRRADTERAYALLLYGAYHGEAGRDPAADLERATTAFERGCLMVGYLAHARTPELAALAEGLGRRPTPRERALLGLLQARAGQAATLAGEEAVIRGARLLGSLVPGQDPIPAREVDALGKGLPRPWQLAARRTPGRSLDDLRGVPLGGTSGAVVLALRELAHDERAAGFALLAERVQEDPAASWLWGMAGDLGLDLPPAAEDQIPPWEAAGLLRLALLDFARAATHARSRAPVARAQLAARTDAEPLPTPAVVVLALGGAPDDHDWFREALAQADPATRSWLQPLWLLCDRQYGSSPAREALLARWGVRYHAGTSGFLDRMGPQYAAMALLSGTVAAEEALLLRGHAAAFDVEHDHPISDEFYADLAVLLQSEHYVWRFEL